MAKIVRELIGETIPVFFRDTEVRKAVRRITGGSGTSGTSGSGTSGTSGSGTSGTTGTSGTSGSGTSGTSGAGGITEPTDYSLKAYAALGSVIVAQPINVTFNDIATSGYIQQSTLLNIIAVWLPTAQTITGVKWVQNTQGDYTASNYNGVGLYTYSGGTLTLVASSTDDGDIWKAAIGVRSKAFSSTYAASAGLYFIATLYSNSANIITPRLGKANANGSGYVTGGDFTNGAKLTSTLAAQTSMPASITASATTVDNNILYVGLY